MDAQLEWTTRANGSLVYANVPFLEYFGIDDSVLATWRLGDNLHPDDVAISVETWRRCLMTGRPYEIEYRFRDKDGGHRWFHTRGAPVRDRNGELVGWFGTSTPIAGRAESVESYRPLRDVYQAFVPRALPAIEGLALSAAYFPADVETNVGGDWYDVVELGDDTVLISMGDVTGHGLPAALSMVSIRQAIISAAVAERDPAEVLRRTGQTIALINPSIASAVVMFVRLRARTVHYALAGHPPPVIATKDAARFLPHGGVLLGVAETTQVRTENLILAANESLVLYTDGLIEARLAIAADELRLLAAAREAAAGNLDAVGIKNFVIGGLQTPDDIAIMAVSLAA